MQVKNFGRAGRTKYTHLVDQDTTEVSNVFLGGYCITTDNDVTRVWFYLHLDQYSLYNPLTSLAASPSPPGRSRWRATKRRAVGGEGLANFALDHVFLECQLHVTCETGRVPVRVDDEFCTLGARVLLLGGIQVGRV